jgi:hypothetical protein
MDVANARGMTKSPVRLAREAMRIAQAALPAYSSPFSPRKFTQHQLFAALILKQFFKTDYRGIVALLKDLGDLRAALGLDDDIPDHSTLWHAERRFQKTRLGTAC